MNLPHHRRYNWKFVWRELRPATYLAILACAIGVLIFVTLRFLSADNARLAAELANKSLALDVHKIATLGAPGYTATDWREGTISVQVRKP